MLCRVEGMSFHRPVVARLITALESHPLPNLTANEQAHLIVLIQTVLEVGNPMIKFQCMGLSSDLDRRTAACTRR
jgi:hypothetical protein